MVAIYVTSLEKGAGKTAVCAGLGKRLLDDGKKLCFFKPIVADSKNPSADGTDSDAAFMKDLFALKEPMELLCPVLGRGGSLASKIKEAYAKVAQGKDVVIMEGVSEPNHPSREIIEALDARVIIVESYSQDLLKSVNSYRDFEKQPLGVIVNKVPKNKVEPVRAETSVQSDKAGIKVLGVLPEDRTLLAPSVGELATYIHGEIQHGAEKSAELVENVMLGALCVDPGPDYFGRKVNKAAIIRSDRPDMQLAALESSTRCLVLTGNTSPKPVVLQRAEVKDVPIILAKDETTDVVAAIEDALGKIKFNQANKLPRLAEIMEQHFDFQAVYKGLGLAR